MMPISALAPLPIACVCVCVCEHNIFASVERPSQYASDQGPTATDAAFAMHLPLCMSLDLDVIGRGRRRGGARFDPGGN